MQPQDIIMSLNEIVPLERETVSCWNCLLPT